MKTIFSNILSGILTGSLVYLLVLLFNVQKSPVSKSNIVSIFIMSACIGIISLIFESERFSFLKLLIIHFWVTLGVVSAMMIYNGWAFNLVRAEFWLDFIVIYILIWLFVRLDIYLKTKKINESLVKLRRNRTKE